MGYLISGGLRLSQLVAVTGVYVHLIRSGVVAFSWGGTLWGLGQVCLQVLGMLYSRFTLGLMVLLAWLQDAWLRWSGRRVLRIRQEAPSGYGIERSTVSSIGVTPVL